jgi:histidine triad (HIT) family protein
MSENCIFCNIANNRISAHRVYEDNVTFAFKDISPKAPIHIIIIPKKHIACLGDVSYEEEQILGHIQIVASKISKQFKEMNNGFRLINNCGVDGGQTIFHIHYHLLGGRVFGWPPG